MENVYNFFDEEGIMFGKAAGATEHQARARLFTALGFGTVYNEGDDSFTVKSCPPPGRMWRLKAVPTSGMEVRTYFYVSDHYEAWQGGWLAQTANEAKAAALRDRGYPVSYDEKTDGIKAPDWCANTVARWRARGASPSKTGGPPA